MEKLASEKTICDANPTARRRSAMFPDKLNFSGTRNVMKQRIRDIMDLCQHILEGRCATRLL